MHYGKWVLSLVALAAVSAPAPMENWAVKLFPEGIHHDFGSVPRGAQLHHRFVVYNIYAVPLQVISHRTSCGCVSVTYPPRPIQPREKAYIDVTMDTRRFTNFKQVQVHLTFGPNFQSTAVLQVSANCRSDVVFNPGEINFGVVQRGQTPTQVIDLEYAGVLDWRILGVSPNGAPVAITVEELYRQPGRVGYRLKVTLKNDAPVGTQKYDLLVQTNDPASRTVPVYVEMTVQAALTVVPSPLNLGTVKVGEQAERRVVVRSSSGGQPFRIVSIEGLGEGLDADIPAAPGPVQIVTIKCQPTRAGSIHRELVFKTDLASEPNATVTIEGSAQ